MKASIMLIVLITSITISSCGGSKFMNKKYTQGVFYEKKRSLKYNTVYVDSTKYLSSIDNKPIFLQSTEKFVDKTVNHLISSCKKDSVFTKKKKNKDEVIVKKNNSPHVLVITEKNNKVTYKKLDKNTYEKLKKRNKLYSEQIEIKEEAQLRTLCVMALFFSIIPIFGFIFCSIIRNRLFNYRLKHPDKNVRVYQTITGLAMVASITSIILFILILTGIFIIIASLPFA